MCGCGLTGDPPCQIGDNGFFPLPPGKPLETVSRLGMNFTLLSCCSWEYQTLKLPKLLI